MVSLEIGVKQTGKKIGLVDNIKDKCQDLFFGGNYK